MSLSFKKIVDMEDKNHANPICMNLCVSLCQNVSPAIILPSQYPFHHLLFLPAPFCLPISILDHTFFLHSLSVLKVLSLLIP